jgi:hypothetical protein
MKRRNTVNRKLKATFLGAVLSCIAATSAHAGWPTIDAGANAKALVQIQTLKNQFTELTNMKSLMQDQVAAFGEFGVLGDLFGGDAFKNVGSKSDFYSNMKKFEYDMCAVNLCTVGDNPNGTTDYDEATEWAKRNFWTSEPLTGPQERDITEVRRRAVVYSAVNGMALATVIHNELASAGEQADALENIVESSQSLRGDVRANSAIALATYKIELQKLATLTAMLNVEASSAMFQTGVYHEEGGNKFPDAFIDSDFATNDGGRRLSVTVPDKGSAPKKSGSAATESKDGKDGKDGKDTSK